MKAIEWTSYILGFGVSPNLSRWGGRAQLESTGLSEVKCMQTRDEEDFPENLYEIRVQRYRSSKPLKMQAPVIVMNDVSSRQTGRKAQISNITAAKVLLSPDHNEKKIY